MKAVKKTDTSVSGASGLVTVNGATLNYVLIRTAANNGGIEFADSVFTTDNSVTFFAAGYDVYNNYLSDESVTWSSSGTLQGVSGTGTSFLYSPSATGSGTIIATSATSGVSSDTTGTLTVNAGTLAELRIQIQPTANGIVLGDTSITADQNLILFAVGYDADGNYLSREQSTWTGNGVLSALSPANPTDSVFIDATTSGSGSVKAVSVANTAITDNSGGITVSPGAVTHLIIKDGPNDAGSAVGVVNMSVGQSQTFYANGYDADNNFSANVNVDWAVTGTLSGLDPTTNSSSTSLAPTSPGSGLVYTTNSSGYVNDSTGTVTVSSGSLSSLEIRTAVGNGGVVLNDSVLSAGATLTLYAAGYDLYGNYLGEQSVTWSVDGDTIGFYSTTTASTNNIFNSRVQNSARLKIVSGSVNDYSGVIKVNPGAAATLTALSAQSLSGTANDFIPDSLIVQAKDSYGNKVPNLNVSWTTPSDGQLSPGTSPPGITDLLGKSRSKWRLRSSAAALDTAYATASGLPAVQFTANVLSSKADSLKFVSGDAQSDTVGAALALPFIVQVVDSLGNPVSNTTITFSVSDFPAGASGFSLSTISTATDAGGNAQTILTLGSLTGSYTVSAYNSNLLNSPQVFNATATNGLVKQISIVSGNTQTDTVGTVLPFPLKVKTVDRNGNSVSGVSLNWQSTSDGLVDGAASQLHTSSSSGLDSVAWTLRTTAGADTVTVSATGVSTALFTATAGNDLANSIVTVSGNKRSTVAGSNQKIVARVLDQYNNYVAGHSVTFAPANSMSALNNISDSNGLVSAVYTTPSDSDSSIATASITSPVSSAQFTVYGIRYLDGSLSPKAVSTNQSVVFYLDVTNPGGDAVPLDTSASSFTFSYNTITTTTKLDSPLTIPAASTSTLKFKTVTIDGGYPSGNYTPEIHLVGSGPYSEMNGSFFTNPGELAVSPLDIVFTKIPNAQDTLVSRGQTISEIQMEVTNNSSETIRNLVTDLTFSPDNGYVETFISGPDSMLTNTSGIYRYSLNIPSGAPNGLVTIDGTVSGNLKSTGQTVNDVGATQTSQFRVIDSAVLTWLAYTPNPLSEGQNVAFSTTIKNDGAYDVLLNKDSTTLTFGGQVFYPSANQALQGNGASTNISFTGQNLSLLAGTYPGTLLLIGTEVGNAFTSTLTTTASGISDLNVQTAANIDLQSITLSDVEVSQGENGQTLSIQFTNSGQATATVLSADSVKISYGSIYQFSLSSGQTFPLYVPAGSSNTLIYTVNVDNAATTGNDTFTAQVAFQDSNSSTDYTEINNTISDTWNVLSKSALTVSALNAVATQVSQGQSGLTVDITLQNSGQTPTIVDTAYIDFKRNLNTFSTATAFPLTLAAGASQDISFSVTIDSNAATGTDSIRALANGSNQRSGAALSETSLYLDGWQVFSAPSVVINSVSSTYSRVNRGQQNVPVAVSVSNQGQATVLIDSLKLLNTPSGSTTDTRVSAIDSLVAGQSKTYNFQSDIALGAPNAIYLGAGFYGRDAISNALVSSTSPVVHDTLQVGDAAQLVIDSVYADFYSFTQGQATRRVHVNVRNSGTSRMSVDSVGLNFTRITPGTSTLSYTRITPASLPVLNAGDAFVASYDLISQSAPRDSGAIAIDAYSYGTDQVSLQPDSVFAALKQDTVLMQTPADPQVIAIANQSSVTAGEQNINVNLTVRNKGTADVRLENIPLDFYTQANGNANSDYTRQYNTPTLPYTLTGWQDTTINYIVGVLDSAANLGTINLRGTAQGTEINRANSITNASGNLSSWTVFGTGALDVVSVVSGFDSISTGQQNIPVQVNISNGGDNPVMVDSIRLAISKGSYADSSLVIYPNALLSPASSATYTLNVDVLSASATGVATLNARVEGTDQNTATAISDPSATTTDSWLVQSAADINITDNSPLVVSTNQDFSTLLTVVNNGDARVDIDTVNTILYPKNSPTNFVKLAASAPLKIAGKQTVQLLFRPTNSTVAFTDSLVLSLIGTENKVTYNQLHTAPNIFTVQDQAVMQIDSTVAAADSVSQGDTWPVHVFVSNTGSAGLQVDSLIFNVYGNASVVSPALPYTILGWTQQDFTATPDVNTSTPTGDVSLDVRGVGEDINSASTANDNAATVSDTWFVGSPPDVIVSSVTSVDTLVAQGESGLQVDVKINNNGGTPVLITDTRLNPQIGLYTQSWPAFNLRLAPNDSTTLTATVDVKDNSATGFDSLFAAVDYKNIYSGATATVNSTTAHRWRISGVPHVNVLSVLTDPVTVSQGQGPETVQVRLENSGSSDATINTLSLVFTNGIANYTLGTVSPSLPLNLGAGLQQVFDVPVTVTNSAQTGLDTISATLNITESVTGANFDVADSTINDSWTVQLRPTVLIDSVKVSPAVASSGQTGLLASVYVRNSSGAFVANADVDSVDLVMKLGGVDRSDQFSIIRKGVPALPNTLAPGATTRFDFDLDVNPNAQEGAYLSDARVVSHDVNDNLSSIREGAQNVDTLTVQGRAVLAVTSMIFIPDTLSQGQTHGRIYTVIHNNGGAPLTVNSSALTFTPTIDMQEIYLSPATPFTLNGGTSDTMIYAITANNSYTGTVDADIVVNGADANDGNSLSASNAAPAQLLIQTPVSPSVTQTTPNSSEGERNEQFRVKVANSGQATLLLNRASTTLTIVGTSYHIHLDPLSPDVIAATPDSTTLVFRDTLLTGMASGEYQLTLSLNGTTNQAAYQQDLDAGAFAYGQGLVVITTIGIEGNDHVIQGQTGQYVNMVVSNSSIALAIDSSATYPVFKDHTDGTQRFMQNLIRLDTLKILPVGTSTLRFKYDVPSTYPVGQTDIYGQVSLDGGSVVTNSTTFDILYVQSSANAHYLAASIVPDTVVISEMVDSRLRFYNTGSADLALIADSSYIDFPGSTIPRALLSGKFTIGGGDTTTLTFNTVTIPANETAGYKDVNWHLMGSMLNGDFYQNDSTVLQAFERVSSAQLIFSSVVIDSDQVLQGETNVGMHYTVQNNGASAAVVSKMNFNFNNAGQSVSNEWLLALQPSFPDTVVGGGLKTFDVQFNVLDNATLGRVDPAPAVTFHDIRTPSISSTDGMIVNNDSVRVIVPASVRIDSLRFAPLTSVPNAPRVNIDQPYRFQVFVQNLGAVDVATAYLTLKRGTTAVSGFTVQDISAGAQKSVILNADSLSIAGEYTYSVLLDSVRDVNGRSVGSVQSIDNSETVIVEQARQLSITSALVSSPESAMDSSVAVGQVFSVQASLAQSGTSQYGPGALRLILPANYAFNGSLADQPIDAANQTAMWQLKAIGESPASNPDSLHIIFGTIPTDSNTGMNVALGTDARDVLMRTLPDGVITVESLVKVSPHSVRDTLSTSEKFVLKAKFSFNNNLKDQTATINLPSGYAVEGASSQEISADSALWTVIAPLNLGQSAGVVDTFRVTAKGTDINSSLPVSDVSSALLLLLQKRAQIALRSGIYAPAGAIDATLSSLQNAVLRTVVQNNGQAGFDKSGVLRFEAHGGIMFKANDDSVLVKNAFGATSYLDSLLMPALPGNGYVRTFINETEMPLDENSADTVLFTTRSDSSALRILERADLTLMIDRTGAGNNTFIKANNQNFMFRARVINNGSAGIDTSNGGHFLRLDTTGTDLSLALGETLRKSFVPGDTVGWQVISADQAADFFIRVLVDAAPKDENDGLNAFRSATAMRDSVRIIVNQVSDISLTANFDPAAPLQNDTLIVSTDQDSIIVQASVIFDSQLNMNKQVNLQLPQGYASVDGQLTRFVAETQNSGQFTWLLRGASSASSSPDTIVIKASGQSRQNPGLQRVSVQKMYVRTIPKANLSLAIRVDAPGGALDSIVSIGQVFRLRGMVQNLKGASPTSGQGSVSISIDPAVFSLIDSSEIGLDASPSRSFSVDKPFFWWVRADKVTGSRSTISTLDLLKQLMKVSDHGAHGSTLVVDGTSQGIPPSSMLPTSASQKLQELLKDKKTVNGGSDISVAITSVPKDINSNTPAAVANTEAVTLIFVEDIAQISIDSTIVPQTVSTGQTFVYTIAAGSISDNLITPQAGVIVPSSFDGGGTLLLPLNSSNKQARFSITVPPGYSGAGRDTLKAFVFGVDKNTNAPSQVSAIHTDVISLQKRPRLALKSKILKPGSAANGILSYGQGLEVKVWVETVANTTGLPYAGIIGSGTVAVDTAIIGGKGGFRLDPGTLVSQSFSTLGEENALIWRLDAPLVDKTVNVSFALDDLPRDANSSADVDVANRSVSHAVRIKQKEITLERIDSLVVGANLIRGKNNQPLLAFKISNTGYDDSLFVNALQVGFYGADQDVASSTLFDAAAISSLFSKLRVVNYSGYRALQKGASSGPQTFADVTVSASDENPLQINFNIKDKMTINPDSVETLMLLGDFKADAPNLAFRPVLTNLNAYDVSDTIALALLDSDGNDFKGGDQGASGIFTVLPDNPKEAFGNFPNPFGRTEALTNITFYLEKDADIDIRIFTLLGEKVWSYKENGLAGGRSYSHVRWNGRNGNNIQVLNGVYICAIQIKPTGGGAIQRFITKIAYIK